MESTKSTLREDLSKDGYSKEDHYFYEQEIRIAEKQREAKLNKSSTCSPISSTDLENLANRKT